MSIILALLLILTAGMVNGSFALPTKHVKQWKFENIWLQYAIWAFVLLPWITILLLAPQVLMIYAAAPLKILLIMAIGGFLFGAGQVGFAFAINQIGIGLAFVICLGLGTGLGFLLPLVFQHPDKIYTPFGVFTILGTLLALAGLLVSTYAGHLRNQNKQDMSVEASRTPRTYYLLGVFLAVIAGVFSAGQNFSFSLTAPLQAIALQKGTGYLGTANIMWPGFLLFTFIPYAAYMLYLHRKNKSFQAYSETGTRRYFLYAFLMGACWYGSLIFYSKASQLIGKLGPIVGWPMFMVLVILTSNFWGWRHQEWDHCGSRAKYALWAGLLLLILSVLVLGYSSSL